MPDYTYIEIDEKLDWIIAEKLMNEYVLKNLSKKPCFFNVFSTI